MLSQEALGARARLHRTYIGQVERAERNPSFHSLERLLSACGVSWGEFGLELDRVAVHEWMGSERDPDPEDLRRLADDFEARSKALQELAEELRPEQRD